MATGKHALGICGRCGFRKPYLSLRRDGYNRALWVCEACLDLPAPKEPDLSDNIALAHARPENNADRALATPLAENFDSYFGGGT